MCFVLDRIASAVNNVIDINKTNNIYQLLEIMGIEINYKDFKNNKTQSCLIKNFEGQYTIFLRRNLDYRYEQFLLAHELGHFVLHTDEQVSFYFLAGLYANRLEREANRFACRLLLADVDINDMKYMDMNFIIKEKGIPLDIWYSLNNII